MDLARQFPRNPREKIAGLVHIPRMADKARAARQNTLGEYIYPCPLDKMMLEFLKVNGESFQDIACRDNDESLKEWVNSLCRNRSSAEKDKVNRAILGSRPDNPEKQKTFNKIRDRIDASKTEVTTWVDLINLEEGRL